MLLARITSGRGGSGSPQSKAEQLKIARLLKQHGTTNGARSPTRETF
jgi:hypothetical protein